MRGVGTRLVVLAALLGALVPLAASAATSAASFTDPAGDQRNTAELTAPDITAVEVSNTPAGLITFRVTIASQSTLPPRSRIAVLFDLDRNVATGFSGFEYALSHEIDDSGQAKVLFERWNPGILEFAGLPTTSVTSTFANGVYTLTVPRNELGRTIGFEFGLYAAALNLAMPSRSAVDDAPNTELWSYELVGLPPPRLASSRLVLVPRRPVAGRTFAVRAVITRLDTGTAITSGSITCAARLGSSRIPTRAAFRSGTAQCTIAIPRTAKRKTLTGSLTVRSLGTAVTKRFSYRIG
jgi:hypothetical protein